MMNRQAEMQQYCEMLENLPQQPENLTKLEKIAENGNADVMYILGWCYFTGQYLAKDLNKSQYWIEKAATLGDKNASKLLVYCQFLKLMEK